MSTPGPLQVATLTPDPSASDVQRNLAHWLGGGGWLTEALCALIDRGRPTVAFFEQQLVHLARLTILHGDRRPADDFADRESITSFIDCLFAVNDLLDEDLEVRGEDALLSWELRQCGINHQED